MRSLFSGTNWLAMKLAPCGSLITASLACGGRAGVDQIALGTVLEACSYAGIAYVVGPSGERTAWIVTNSRRRQLAPINLIPVLNRVDVVVILVRAAPAGNVRAHSARSPTAPTGRRRSKPCGSG